jgi:hypothetical protein
MQSVSQSVNTAEDMVLAGTSLEISTSDTTGKLLLLVLFR